MRLQRIAWVIFLAAGLTMPAAFGQDKPKTVVRTVARGTGFLGVGIQEIDAERAKTLKLREEAGVEITQVDANSPAEKAGLKAGDVVTEYNGQRVEGIEQFSRMVRETPAGRDAKLGIMRNGVAQTVTAQVAARNAPGISINGGNIGGNINIPFSVRIPDIPTGRMSWRSTVLGVEAERVEGQFAEFFGAKEGVLVRSVVTGSAAEKAGIKAGDVITKVADMNVTTPSDLSGRLRAQQGKTVPVVLLRDKREMTVNVTVEQDNRGKLQQQRLQEKNDRLQQRLQDRVLRRRADAGDEGTVL
jgi:serine protease Do